MSITFYYKPFEDERDNTPRFITVTENTIKECFEVGDHIAQGACPEYYCALPSDPIQHVECIAYRVKQSIINFAYRMRSKIKGV